MLLRAAVVRNAGRPWPHGWRLAAQYVDRASGKNGERQEFQRMFADAAERKFDLVLFWSLERFSREGVLETLQRLTGNGGSGMP